MKKSSIPNSMPKTVSPRGGSSEELPPTLFTSSTGQVIVGSTTVNPSGGPIGTTHVLTVEVLDDWEDQVPRVTVRTTQVAEVRMSTNSPLTLRMKDCIKSSWCLSGTVVRFEPTVLPFASGRSMVKSSKPTTPASPKRRRAVSNSDTLTRAKMVDIVISGLGYTKELQEIIFNV